MFPLLRISINYLEIYQYFYVKHMYQYQCRLQHMSTFLSLQLKIIHRLIIIYLMKEIDNEEVNVKRNKVLIDNDESKKKFK